MCRVQVITAMHVVGLHLDFGELLSADQCKSTHFSYFRQLPQSNHDAPRGVEMA